MKRLSVLLFSLFVLHNMFAQETLKACLPSQKSIKASIGFCAQHHVHQRANRDAAYRQMHEQIEQRIYEHFQKGNTFQTLAETTSPPPYTLPVVVHVIHDGGVENIPDAQVIQGIQDLNDAYANIGYYNPTTGVNTLIQFCLAQRDPDGNATTGINRVQTPLTDMTIETDDITVKDLSRWDPLEYINIWLVREICSSGYGCGVAGYAYFPTSHGQPEDGIMMEAEYFGSSQGASGVQIHEMGHYLGLYHTFQDGCGNNDCLTDGDRVCDTPPDQSTAWLPCGTTANSCSTDTQSGFSTDQDDLVEDYMDYNDFDCYSMFTQGQTERMHWHIENVRFSLLDSEGCLDPCLSQLTASFSSSLTNLEVGGTVNFTNTSVNTTSAEWEIDGSVFSNNMDADYTFNSVGTFEICLNVGNDDPNCSDVFCENITVTCPVEAGFSTTVFYPNPGEVVSYSNSSTGATEYEWKVNGTVVGTSQNLDYAFADEGIYDLCLSAGNGLCADEFCLQVFVAESPSGGCDNATFVRIFGGVGVDEEGMTIVPSGDGNLYLGGRSGGEALIVKMDINGDPIWQRSFDVTSKNDLISQLYVDSDGNLVVCGYGEDSNPDGSAYVFKYDPLADALLWTWNYSGGSRCFNVIEPVPGGDYIITQDLRNSPSPGAFEDAILREIDRNTGATTGNLAQSYNIGSSETFSNTVLYNGQMYATGRYTNGAGTVNMRHSLTRFDLNGFEVWSKGSHVPLSGQARLYGRDMVIENDEIISIASGDDNGSSATVTNFFLQKNDLDGNLIWTKKYEIPSMQNEWTEEIVSTADGFLMLGYERASPTELFIVKTDKDGNVIWAKSYGDLGDESIRFTCESQMLALGNFIYFTAWSNSFNGSRDMILVKTDSEGNLEDDCLLGNDIDVIMTEVGNPVNFNFDLQDYPNPQTETSVSVAPETPMVPFQDLEGCECIPDEGGCDTTFLKTYGTPQDEEVSHAIAVVPDALGGGFLLGGGKADSAMITWVDEVGDIIWTRSFDATSDAEDYITDLIFDSDNMVAGVGMTKNEPAGNRECFIFRYDMQANVMLWVNELDLNDPANETYVSIVEKNAGGNFVVSGQTDDYLGLDGCNGILVEVDRNTGANQWQRNYDFGSCETFQATILADGDIFTTGRYNFDGGGTDRMRPGVTRFDLNGNQIWSRFYLEPVAASDNARLYSTDLVDDNGIVVVGHGDEDGSSTTANEIFLFRTDYDGNIEWARKFDIPGTTEERAVELLNLPDGYLVLGRFTMGDVDSYVFKTDKFGNLQWAKSYGASSEDETATDFLWQAGQVYFTGNLSLVGNGDVFLANIAADGTVSAQDSCNLFGEINVVDSEWANPYDGQHDLEDLSQQWGNFLSTAIMGETAVQTTVECFVSCLDSCDLVPEALFEGASALCGGDGLDLELTVCNTGNFDLPAGTPVTIYDADPTAGSANAVATLSLDVAVGNGECETFSLTFSGSPNATYFVLINDDGTSPTPIDLTTFEGVEEECDYTNNLGSFIYQYTAPTLDLGPDISSCDNQAVTLDAGPGFAEYKWNDGSEMQTLTAIFPGTYSVTVTDECGGTQSDEITISVDPATVLDMGPDQELCEGGVITYDLGSFFFESYEWTPMDGVTCLNPECSQVEISPTEDITYTVIATDGAGCFSVDSFSVTVSEVTEIIEDVAICEGDTVLVFGDPVFEPGEYSMTFTSSEGCDSIHTISVGVLDTVITQEEILLCWGDSVEVFGEVVYGGGPYQMTFTSENGCDSTHIVNIVGHPKIFILPQVMHVSCFGGMNGSAFANVIGGGLDSLTYLWNTGATTPMLTGLSAGTYTVTVTDGICPEEAEFLVFQPSEIMLNMSSENAGCEVLGSASAEASGGSGTITFEWSNGETTADIFDLEAGIYEVTATDQNGCEVTASVEITGALGPDVSITIDDLPNEDDPMGGALTANVSGGTSPYTYEWSNGGDAASQNGLASGEYSVTVTDANGCTAEATVQIYLPACTGGKIWNDLNRDGCQDGGELGMAGITLELNGTDIWGNDITLTTTTAINGEYIFEPLPPGDYQVTLPLPTGYAYSPVDACLDDFTDSDFDADGLSYTVELTEGHCCLIVDGGLYDACINVYDPGEICCDQILCGPGLDPAPIASVSPATGGAPIEYMWMYTTEMGAGGITFSNGQWTGIPGTNSPSYDPGPIQQTTYYARCVRAVGCTDWLEMNVVEIFVDDVAVAEITSPPSICVGDEVTFYAAENPAGATYSWNFGPTATPSTSTEQNPVVTFSEFGYPMATLSVTYGGCTSTDTELIAVSNDPVYCGTAIQAPGGNPAGLTTEGLRTGDFFLYPNPASDFVTVRWAEAIEGLVSIELMSVDGRHLSTAKADGSAQFFQTDLSQYVPGVYVLRVRYGEGETETFRVVKE